MYFTNFPPCSHSQPVTMVTQPPPLSAFTFAIVLLAMLTLHTESITIHKGTEHKEDRIHPNPTPRNEIPLRNPVSVNCSDRKKFCKCPIGALACKFVLTVEELQTFTSYKLEDTYEDFLLLTVKRVKTQGTRRGTAGDVYYLNGRGYTPVLPPHSEINKPPEYGDCYIGNDVTTEGNITDHCFRAKDCTVPITVDGATFRMFIGINGQIPGPTLIAHENQILEISVQNKLTSEGISVHWHGLHQKGTPWMDGVGFVTQPPITPGAHFDYIFNATPAGTHWYHSHIGAQRTDGLYGALVIMEKKQTLEEMEYVSEGRELRDLPEYHTISLLDWQRESSLNLFVRIHSTLGYFPDIGVGEVPTQLDGLYHRTHSTDAIEVGPVPYWSGLMNGKGRHNADTFSILSTFDVEKGISYRFRVIGAQSLYAFKFSIDRHRLHLIATDGQFIEGKMVDFIIIHTGERYDFILHADEEIDNYWMRAETLEADANERHMAEGILHYMGANQTNPNNKYTDIRERRRTCTRRRRCTAVNCPFKAFPAEMNTDCLHLDKLRARVPHSTPRILRPRDKDNDLRFFNFGFEGVSSTSAINGMNFKLPTTPYQTYCDQYDNDVRSNKIVCQKRNMDDYRICVNVANIAAHETYSKDKPAHLYPSVNFVLSSVGIEGNNNFSHPIHLHGHTFYVVAVRHGRYDRSGELLNNSADVVCLDENNEIDKLCKSPRWKGNTLPPYLKSRSRVSSRAILKDTVIVPAGGYVVIAFEANNPGYWFMHCHIEPHQLEGMAVIVQEYPSSQQWTPPDSINRIGNFTWSLDDYDNTIAAGKMCQL